MTLSPTCSQELGISFDVGRRKSPLSVALFRHCIRIRFRINEDDEVSDWEDFSRHAMHSSPKAESRYSGSMAPMDILVPVVLKPHPFNRRAVVLQYLGVDRHRTRNRSLQKLDWYSYAHV